MESTFRFVDDELNKLFIKRLSEASVNYRIDSGGVVHYSPDDEALVGNEILPSIRKKVFSRWQIISCPADWADRYRQYMMQHEVPYVEEFIDGKMGFLISRKYRPNAWQLEELKANAILPQKRNGTKMRAKNGQQRDAVH